LVKHQRILNPGDVLMFANGDHTGIVNKNGMIDHMLQTSSGKDAGTGRMTFGQYLTPAQARASAYQIALFFMHNLKQSELNHVKNKT